MSDATLPAAFSDLEGWARRYAHPDFNERYARRLASTQAELEAFYRALTPRVEAIGAYLDGCSMPLPTSQARLLALALAFMDVAPAVELYHQPAVPAGFDARRARVIEHVAASAQDSNEPRMAVSERPPKGRGARS